MEQSGVYDWQSFLRANFRDIPDIKKQHHFPFSKDAPGVVFLREFAQSTEHEFNMLIPGSTFPQAPNVIPV